MYNLLKVLRTVRRTNIHVCIYINQGTSGPVNAHLTPGPGIYFNAFIHVYSPRAGADNPMGTKFTTERPFLFANMLQVSK